jgi:hypothetical protein
MIRFLLVTVLICTTATLAASPASASIGLKNFRELLRALSVVTHVPSSDASIQAYYRKIQGQLPQSGSLVEFSPQSWLAAVGLGSVFCDTLIVNGAQGGVSLNEGVDFSKGPSAVGATLRITLAQRYILAFLQRPATAAEQDQLVQLFSAQATSTDTPQETHNGILAMCATTAGSIEFLSN